MWPILTSGTELWRTPSRTNFSYWFMQDTLLKRRFLRQKSYSSGRKQQNHEKKCTQNTKDCGFLAEISAKNFEKFMLVLAQLTAPPGSWFGRKKTKKVGRESFMKDKIQFNFQKKFRFFGGKSKYWLKLRKKFRNSQFVVNLKNLSKQQKQNLSQLRN